MKPSLSHRILAGPSHPICLVATVVLLLNDHVFKAAYHNTLTGKLSDICWLIVASVVLAAGLHFFRVSARLSQRLALCLVGSFFVALQLVPALGETLVGWYGGMHVADVTDLLALPALLMVPLCWRGRAKKVPLALGVSIVACVATSPPDNWDLRYPCDGASNWDPNVPLYLEFQSWSGRTIPTRTPAFQQGIRVYTADNKEVDVFITQVGESSVVICPDGGLEPGTEYFWTAGPFETESTNMISVQFDHTEVRSFTTDESSDNSPITTSKACRGVNPDVYSLLECPGDPGSARDTGDAQDTGGDAQ